MKREELEKVMGWQKRAYGLLMWLNQKARSNPAMLSAEAVERMASAESCVSWINHHLNSLPREFWPESSDLVPFARLFSSFFATSFRVGEVGRRDSMRVETGLVTGAKKINDRRHKKHLERRQKEAARELKRRTEYVSQGTAVHGLWLELDEKTRKRMDVEMVWKAKETVTNAVVVAKA